MSKMIFSAKNEIKFNYQEFNRDLTAAVTDLAQSLGEIYSKYKTKLPEQFVSVLSGKIGAFVSVTVLFDKYSKGADTLSDWLAAGADITLLIAGYTGNPMLAGLATALGVASFLTSDIGVGAAQAWLDAVQKYGLVDPETGQTLLPPRSLNDNPPAIPDMRKPENTTSPIILDLDGDGIETRALQDGIFFDHDGNQFAENTGWVAVDDGLLVLDRNSNGVIDSGSELFGNNTTLNDGSLAKNGYQALQVLDLNQDGMINAYD